MFLLVQPVPSLRSAAVYWVFVLFVCFFLIIINIFYSFSSWSDLEFRFVLSSVSLLLSVKPCLFELVEKTCTEEYIPVNLNALVCTSLKLNKSNKWVRWV